MSTQSESSLELGRRLFLFALTFGAWLLFTWPFAPFRWQMVFAGGLVSMVSSFLFVRITTEHPGKALDPRRYFWGACYILVLAWWVMMANLDVVYRVIHPRMPIEPGIVKIETDLNSDSARTALANSITLTPGTMTVDITEEGELYVHWINVVSEEEKTATELVGGRFEWLLRRIFE